MRTIEQMVQTEVYCGATVAVIHILSEASRSGDDTFYDMYKQEPNIPDYVEAFRYASVGVLPMTGMPINIDGWQEVFDKHGLDYPASQDVLEYWIVSQWLAEKLAARGEVVEMDFHGLIIWGRTTSGQSIVMDPVIEDIYREVTGNGRRT